MCHSLQADESHRKTMHLLEAPLYHSYWPSGGFNGSKYYTSPCQHMHWT